MSLRVKIGVGFGPWLMGVPDAKTLLTFVDRCEEWGVDSLWFSDRLVGTPIMEPLTMLAVAAGRTQRIKLGTSVLVLPLRQPVLLAKAIATLDYLSGGRIILGVGVGGRVKTDFEASGVSLSDRGRRTDEAIVLLKRLWAEPEVTYHGRFYSLERVAIAPKPAQLPKPIQQPYPPIWIGGKSEAALKRVARLGDGWLPSQVTPEEFQEGRERIRGYAQELGRDPSTIEFGLLLTTCIMERREEAIEVATHFLAGRHPENVEEAIAKYYAVGTAEDCVHKIENFMAVGVDKFALALMARPDDLLAQLSLCVREVIPAFAR